MTWKEFSLLSREVYVEIASREYGIDGRPTNVSRVAILTGLSRKQVREQRERIAAREDAAAEARQFHMTPATRVITGWHEDPDFSDGGKARDLKPSGKNSFAELLQRYGGDIPRVALEKELKRTGVVTETADGRLHAAKRVFMPAGLDAQYLRLFGAHLHDLGQTIAHNGRSAQPRFQRVVSSERLPAAAAEQFHALVREEGQQLLERLDAWLAQHDADGGDDAQRVGAGIYFFNDNEAP